MSKFINTDVIMSETLLILVNSHVIVRSIVYEQWNKWTSEKCSLLEYTGAVFQIFVSSLKS